MRCSKEKNRVSANKVKNTYNKIRTRVDNHSNTGEKHGTEELFDRHDLFHCFFDKGSSRKSEAREKRSKLRRESKVSCDDGCPQTQTNHTLLRKRREGYGT